MSVHLSQIHVDTTVGTMSEALSVPVTVDIYLTMMSDPVTV